MDSTYAGLRLDLNSNELVLTVRMPKVVHMSTNKPSNIFQAVIKQYPSTKPDTLYTNQVKFIVTNVQWLQIYLELAIVQSCVSKKEWPSHWKKGHKEASRSSIGLTVLHDRRNRSINQEWHTNSINLSYTRRWKLLRSVWLNLAKPNSAHQTFPQCMLC